MPGREAFAAIPAWRALRSPPLIDWADGQLRVGSESWPVQEPGLLLSHLAESWSYFHWEQVWPLGFNPDHPRQLWSLAEDRWRSMSRERVEEERAQLQTWWDRHSLLVGHKELTLVIREGRQAVVWTDESMARRSLDALLRDIEQVGEQLAADAPPGIRRAWQARAEPGRHIQWLLETGWNADIAPPLAPEVGEESILSAAARMIRSANLSDSELREVLETISNLPRGMLMEEALSLSAEATAYIDTLADMRWYDQGYQLAVWLRAKLGKSGRIDPKKLLQRWGVTLHERTLPTAWDAVACWTDQTAAIAVNPQGVHARTMRGRRATWAHEIAHLLVDRSGVLPVAEVLGGLTPRSVERRANAFAAEFLAPQDELQALCEREGLMTADAAVKKAMERYQVSRQLVAHQLVNAGASRWGWLPREVRRLEQLVEPHGDFWF